MSYLFLYTISSPLFFIINPRPPPSTLFPYTTLFRSQHVPGDGPQQVLHHRPRSARCRGCEDGGGEPRSEEHTSELQSRFDLVCRLLLEKKKIRGIALIVLDCIETLLVNFLFCESHQP